ncbi:MAG TPA: hypothetical protein VFI46_11615 [Jiangellaceae bacterium]|nr:hypothetical protein [Jiangellaceae bacterium]
MLIEAIAGSPLSVVYEQSFVHLATCGNFSDSGGERVKLALPMQLFVSTGGRCPQALCNRVLFHQCTPGSGGHLEVVDGAMGRGWTSCAENIDPGRHRS